MSDQLNKKLNLASKAVDAATKFLDSASDLKKYALEYTASSLSFQDADFTGSGDLRHLDAYTMGALLSTVTTAIEAAITDAGNGNFNLNVLEKVRK